MTRRNRIRRAAAPGWKRSLGWGGPPLTAFLVSVAAALVAAGGATAEPPGIAAKRAEAARVLAQVHALDSELSHAIEGYNLANVELDRIRARQRRNAFLLRHAKANFRRAHARLEQRLVALYTAGSAGGSTIEVVLGARNIGDVLNALETAERVSAQDTEVVDAVERFRAQTLERRAQLARARARQARIVRERAARRAEVERRLGERQRLLAGIRDQIARMEAAERARQERLRREAAARLAAQRRAAAAQRAAASAPAPASSPAEAPTDAGSPEAALPTSSAAPPPARHGGVVGIAMQYLGVPYKWGGASPSTGFDCSGLVMYVYAQVGVSLPHSTYALWPMGSPVPRSQLQPGDLVFFNGLGHMGIYIGGNQMIHAPRTGDVVKISPLTGWYASTYMGARRIG